MLVAKALPFVTQKLSLTTSSRGVISVTSLTSAAQVVADVFFIILCFLPGESACGWVNCAKQSLFLSSVQNEPGGGQERGRKRCEVHTRAEGSIPSQLRQEECAFPRETTSTL